MGKAAPRSGLSLRLKDRAGFLKGVGWGQRAVHVPCAKDSVGCQSTKRGFTTTELTLTKMPVASRGDSCLLLQVCV